MNAAAGAMSPAQIRGMIAAIAAVSTFAFSLSLSVPLIAINLERLGASGVLIGLNTSASAVAILAGGFVMPSLLRLLSAPVLMVGGVLAMACLLLVFPLWPDPYFWIALRFVFGFSATALFFCSELWIISAAPPERRGLMIGVYVFFLSFGFLAGPAILAVVGTEGWPPFLIGSAISLIAIAPVAWARRDTPDFAAEMGEPAGFADVLRFFRSDAAILGAVMLFGVMEFGAMGLFPVWSLRVGIEEQAALILVSLLAAGNLVTQIPMGWIGDKLDRRRLLGGCAFACVIASGLFPLFSQTVWPLWITAAVWGGLVAGLYTFALNELGSRYSGQALARANGAVMIAYGLGSLGAPTGLGAAMDAFPPHGMFALMAAAAIAYILVLALRRRRTA